MNTRRHTLASIGIALLFAAGLSAEVKVDYDRSADFSQMRTYSWEQVRTANPLWVDRIKSAVDADLATKGWTRVDSGGDVAVVATEMTHDRQTLNTVYDNLGGGWLWGGFGTSSTSVEHYKVGTLVIDMFNRSNKSLIWRGSATDTLSSKSEKNIKSLDKSIHHLFEHFPPGTKR